ncbi:MULTISPECIES: SDR family NAD(P)-dependent oxidoreductase [unclassified Cupriavidus]|uniref:SDR family NAD(P)-dependent oxidoreductase n=1 Tax=unclassified Cupriavidus TaxID=2640874 RepID=UPI001AE430F6|nr:MULTISPECIES: SDR family oxidoreductase [unclassified Cupriavidus]MBP0630845.1 SDR family oxidoreductase [Cupriavidus sp. AcVe19-1a]MBP0634235.1 SDR family oxidoreductase [Cupriavidus sp. AcVe19-6a]
MLKLKEKIALVTGAGRGLGGVIAQAMAREGAQLVLCDIDTQALEHTRSTLEAEGAQCLAVRCDVSDSAAVDAMFEQAAERFGTVDILVNNAAIVPSSAQETERRSRHYAYVTTPMPRQSLGIVSSLTDQDWLKWWGVNMHGVFYCTRAALRLMEPRRSGKIINIASVAGWGAASMHSPGYAATKAGVISLTQTTAFDAAGANIFVNAIACGGVMTPPFEAYLANASEAEKRNLFQMVPLGRLGQPSEYASLAVYLASDEHYLVGQVISPNGGYVI